MSGSAKRCHLVGIGGVGMSALAQALVDAGHEVSGSDRQLRSSGARSPALDLLSRQGVRLAPDDGSLVDSSVGRLIVSTAIEPDNPDLAKARSLGVIVAHRAAALSELLSSRKLVAVAGTCGKSTVTAMLGHFLSECGFCSTVVNGAPVVGWDFGGSRVGSARKGAGEWAVAEVDESDKSLGVFSPYAAIITNASADHYGLDEMNEVFDAFRLRVSGPILDGRRERIVPSPLAREIPLPGEHNAVNAECALWMARLLGADETRLAAAVRTFPGVERRLQKVGENKGTAVFDDYAHNPEKLRATWTTLAAAYSKGLAVVWRPHGYGPLAKMLEALAATFRELLRPQDLLVLPPVYDAGGTAKRELNSDALAEKIAMPCNVVLVPDLSAACSLLAPRLGEFGAVVIAGARDPELPVLARRLVEAEP